MDSPHFHRTTRGEIRGYSTVSRRADGYPWGRQTGLLIDVDDAEQFVDRGGAFQYLEDTIIGQRLHPLGDGLLADLIGGGALEDHFADRLAHGHQFKDPQPAFVAGPLAPVAAFASIEEDLFALLRLQPQTVQGFDRRGVRFAAVGADRPGQPLRQDSEYR